MQIKKVGVWSSLGVLIISLLLPAVTSAASTTSLPDAGLSLEVSPSPIVLTIKPGESKSVDVKIFNAGSAAENLKIGLQNFSINKSNSTVTLQKGVPPEVSDWVKFSLANFSIKSGERITETVTIKVPASAGFSYNFAMVISRQTPPKAVAGQSAVVGSVAIFTLLNIDRPDAVRKLVVDSLTTDKHYYEYLPATLKLKLRNDGNSLLLPGGNAYIQRKGTSATPISVLAVNPGNLYLLPGITREYQFTWKDGLPAYVTSQTAINVAPERHLEWNWRNSHFRIGKYVAKVVIVYDNGRRDVPVETEVSFWVLPWKLLLGITVGFITLLVGVGAILRLVFMTLKRNRFKYRAK
ncbi:MAG: hypothetical protein QFB87_01845 [Patescibacteria group bacterium]|nr:hypothetical protein [Patescibacteria group bacterium]